MSPTWASGWFSAMGFLPIAVDSGSGRWVTVEQDGAEAPVDDLGLVDREAVVVGGGQAGHLADGAVDVDDRAAGAADEVVVVVADPALVAGDRARRLDAPDQAGVGERPQRVVDGLVGDLGQVLRTAPMTESVSAWGMLTDRGQHRRAAGGSPAARHRAAAAGASGAEPDGHPSILAGFS